MPPKSSNKSPLSSDSEQEPEERPPTVEHSDGNESDTCDSDEAEFAQFRKLMDVFLSLPVTPTNTPRPSTSSAPDAFGTPTNTYEPIPSTSSAPDPALPDLVQNEKRLTKKEMEFLENDYPLDSDEESRKKRRSHPRNSCTPKELKRCLTSYRISPNYKRLKAKKFATANEYFNLKLQNHHGDFDVYPPEETKDERMNCAPGEKFARIFANIPELDIDFDLDSSELEEKQANQNTRTATRSKARRGRPSQNVKKQRRKNK